MLGTTEPIFRLSDAAITAQMDSTLAQTICQTASCFPPQRTVQAATERMRIDSSGICGIGTTSPIGALHINGAANNVASRIRISSTEGSGLTLRAESATASMINVDSSENLLFGVGGGEVARIDSSGRLLVGHNPT